MIKTTAKDIWLESRTKARLYNELTPMAIQLDESLKTMEKVTSHLMVLGEVKGPDVFLADAVLYLEFFGIITIGWQWLKQAVAAQKALNNELSKTEAAFFAGKFLYLPLLHCLRTSKKFRTRKTPDGR